MWIRTQRRGSPLSRLVLARTAELETETGEDGYLFADELARLRLDAELVVLSACETSGGRTSPLEGVHSLSRVALATGPDAVISTLGRVSDPDARHLMVDFYRGWIRAGESRIRALADAKRNAIAAGRHVKTWAGYLLWDAGPE